MAETYKVITETPGWLNRLVGDGVPDDNASLYRKVPYLFRLVQLRCDTLSSVPVKLYKLDDEDEVDEQEWPYPTKLKDLLWWWEAGALLSGAAYGEIMMNSGGYQKDVRYRNPFYMDVKYKDGIITIKQNSSGTEWKNNIFTDEYEMVYFAEYDPSQDLLPGVSPAISANVDAKLLYALSKFPEMYFEGGAMPVTVVGVDTTDEGEIKRMETFFKKVASGLKNAFRTLGTRANSIDVQTITPPLKDLAMPEINAQARDNLLTAFGVPKTLLDSEAANYATAQEDRKSFYQETIMPRARRYEDILNLQLLRKEDLRLEFSFNELELFQEDENERAELLSKLTFSGLPLELAMRIAGYELTDEEQAMLEEKQQEESDDERDELTEELGRWARMAEKRVKDGRDIREFETDIIPGSLHAAITGALESVETPEDVKLIFDNALEWRGYP
jgi:HK97 family phage portal protein